MASGSNLSRCRNGVPVTEDITPLPERVSSVSFFPRKRSASLGASMSSIQLFRVWKSKGEGQEAEALRRKAREILPGRLRLRVP
jgi:hypothetical protein